MTRTSCSRRSVMVGAALTVFIPSRTRQRRRRRTLLLTSINGPCRRGKTSTSCYPSWWAPFKREPSSRGHQAKSDEDLNVTYRSGPDSIDVGFSIPETPEDAHEAIKVTREEAIASKVPLKGARYSVNTEPSFFHVADFVSWSRGRYFYYAKASSPAALTRFMEAFPY